MNINNNFKQLNKQWKHNLQSRRIFYRFYLHSLNQKNKHNKNRKTKSNLYKDIVNHLLRNQIPISNQNRLKEINPQI